LRAETQVSTHRSRAQVLRDRVEIRLAVNEAGPQIESVLKANGIVLPDANWGTVFPHWLIACVDELVIGCCQVLHSKPVGYVEFLTVHPEAPFKIRAIALRKLMLQSINSIYAYGAQYVGGVVGKENRKFADVIGKMGFVKTYQADMYAKRIR
jgi:hypothetical protein